MIHLKVPADDQVDGICVTAGTFELVKVISLPLIPVRARTVQLPVPDARVDNDVEASRAGIGQSTSGRRLAPRKSEPTMAS